MSAFQADLQTIEGGLGGDEFASIVSELLRRDDGWTAGAGHMELPLRCVWSDSGDACACHSRIPQEVVERAWRRELDASGDREGRFFHLIWDGGVWLAYGLPDGHVRGVYCPSHNSQRAERSHAAICDPGEVVCELPLAV
jgi:hypothetical protein